MHLLRHPQPAVAPGLCYGATDMPALDYEIERVHAELIARGLPGALPVFSSPLRRCAELAQRLQPHGPQLDARLAEMDFGAWEMRAWSDIPRAEVDAWAADLSNYRPGGGENLREVAARVNGFANDLLRAGHAAALIVCHAGTIRLLTALCAGLPLEQAAATPHRIGYGELVVLERQHRV
nr:histidine phosphatase family protein [Massilia terrae]